MSGNNSALSTGPYSAFDPASYACLEKRLERGETPTPTELALVLAANGSAPLPEWFVRLLVASLRGELRHKPGPRPKGVIEDIRIILARERYRELLAWLQKRKQRQGLTGWSCIRGKDWWQGPPHERAARIVAASTKRFNRVSWRRLANIISSRNS